jgi:hypothetical protein
MRGPGMVALALAAAGCPRTFGDDCTTDDDCGGGRVCARNRQCQPPDQVHAVNIRWTVDGVAADATSCAGIDQLEVGYQIGDDDTSRVVFVPVRCEIGAFPNDKWPTAYDTALIYAASPRGSTYQQAAIPPGPTADVFINILTP